TASRNAESNDYANRLREGEFRRLAWEKEKTLSDERMAQLMMAMGKWSAGLAAYKAALGTASATATANTQNPHLALHVVVLEWVLASYGDHPLERFENIVGILQKMAAANQLPQEHAQLLVDAETKVSDIQRRGARF